MSGKEKAEEMVRERDKVIRKEEIETKGKQKERQAKLRKMQHIKKFKPTMGKKKRGKGKAGNERKKPCPAYVLWCKVQWREIKKENSGADFKEVSNALGVKGKTINAVEKQTYEERYK